VFAFVFVIASVLVFALEYPSTHHMWRRDLINDFKTEADSPPFYATEAISRL